MKNYNIYSNGSGLVAIKEGFSWPALFFGPLWGFTKGFWIWDVILLIVMIVSGGAATPLIGLIYGCYGNKWWTNRVLKNGQTKTTSVQAPNPNSAIMLAQLTK